MSRKPTHKTQVRLKKLREKLAMSQRELAKELGVTPGAVALWELGERSLSGPAERLVELYETGALPVIKSGASTSD